MPFKGFDLTGRKFGRLTVLERVENHGRFVRWRCSCECGNETIALSNNLLRGCTKSCGCLRKKTTLDLTGQRFGRLVVIERASHVGRRTAWKCLCDCGNTCTVQTYLLRGRNTSSCGCLHKQRLLLANQTHKETGSRLHRIWTNMKSRCHNPKATGFQSYGGRGIRVCDEWNSYENFRDWALSNGYNDDLTIDRIDVNGNYCPENCRWLSKLEQERNRRNSLTFEGKSLTQWAKDLNVPYSTLYARIFRGASIEEAIRAYSSSPI